MSIALRPVTFDDVTTLTALHRAAFGDEAWSEQQMRGSLELPTTRGLVALINEQCAGFILWQQLEGESEILTFCTAPSHQRRGIGAQLLAVMMQGQAHIHLEVAADNLAARALYTRHGFAQIGVRPRYYQRGSARIDAIAYSYKSKS